MLVSPAPIAIPVNTANPPTEAVTSEAAQKTPITQPPAASDSSNTRNSTESNEYSRVQQEASKDSEQLESKQENGSDEEKSREDQKRQENRQEKREQAADQKIIDSLRLRDREVKAHEQAHAAVGGRYAGAPQFTFQTGPDGKRYAVSGEVAIDISKAATPEATLSKMNQVKRAALAPAEPSGQDRAVAAKANQIGNQARVEIRQLKVDELKESQEANRAKAAESEENEDGQSAEGLSSVRNERESGREVFNPVAARLAASRLNQRIYQSGALDDVNQSALLSQNA